MNSSNEPTQFWEELERGVRLVTVRHFYKVNDHLTGRKRASTIPFLDRGNRKLIVVIERPRNEILESGATLVTSQPP